MTLSEGYAIAADGPVAKQWSAVLESFRVSQTAPMSARHALHAAVLIDQLSDLAFARRASLPFQALAAAGDFPAFRAALRLCEPALGPIMDLTRCVAEGPHLCLVATEVAPEGFESLPVADLMVSLYNDGTVPRLMLAEPGGTMLPMQDLLKAAIAWWGSSLGT